MIDAYLPAPGAGRDEGFHSAVSELLEEWAHDTAPALPAVRIIAQQQSARAHELRDVLARNGIPYIFYAAESADGQSWLQQGGQDGSALPVLVMYTGEVLVDRRTTGSRPPSGWPACPEEPSMWPSWVQAHQRSYPGDQGVRAGMVLRRHPVNSWASHRARSHRGWLHPAPPPRPGNPCPRRPDHHGVSYRRLDAPGLDSLLGAGVFYGATGSESSTFAGEHVFIAGGANSAGQAAVNLARYAQQVTIVVRGGSLAARMSQYLIDEIAPRPTSTSAPAPRLQAPKAPASWRP
jgi:thioredoxin reductase (NADPH)